jgi:hypothetical protein
MFSSEALGCAPRRYLRAKNIQTGARSLVKRLCLSGCADRVIKDRGLWPRRFEQKLSDARCD